MPAGTNFGSPGAFYPREIDTDRDREGGRLEADDDPETRTRERAAERDYEDAENPVRDPARRVVHANPADLRSGRIISRSCFVRFPSVLSTWGARALDRIAIRDRVAPANQDCRVRTARVLHQDVRFFAKKGDVYFTRKKARLIARDARAYDVHYDRGRLASVSSPLSFSKA
jgi:hypothetical protein